MAEEQSQVVATETPAAAPEPEAKQYNEVEQAALAQGWQDKDAWVEAGHDPDQHRSAREFIDRGELLGKLKANSQELRQLRDAVTQMSVHNQKVYQAGIEEGIRQLKTARAAALREGDVEHALKLEEALDARKEELENVKVAQRVSQVQAQQNTGASPEFQSWLNRNKWYLEDPVLHHWAKGMAMEFTRVNPSASEEETYRFLDREVRKNFPDKFKRAAPPNPDGGGRQTSTSASRGGGKDEFEKVLATMNEGEARAARNLVATVPGLTKEKYVEQYRQINRE